MPSDAIKWFYGGCIDWYNGCVVTEAQRSEMPGGVPPFMPEPLCGNPLNEAWFLSLNPGLGTTEQKIHQQQEYCPYREDGRVLLDGRELGSDEYVEHFRSWYKNCGWVWLGDDYVTRGALSIALELGGRLGDSLPRLTMDSVEQYRRHLRDLTVLNVVHCKSRGWTSAYLGCRCIDKTREIMLDPSTGLRNVFLMGRDVWEFVASLGWFDKDDLSWAESGRSEIFPKVVFTRTYHPGRRTWNRPGLFSLDHVRTAVRGSRADSKPAARDEWHR